MKKLFAVVLALALILGASAVAAGLEPYKGRKVGGTKVEPVQVESVTVEPYQGRDVEAAEPEATPDPEATKSPIQGRKFRTPTPAPTGGSGLGAYQPREIKNVGVQPIQMDVSTIAPYETHEITGVDVEPIQMDVSTIAPYETREITGVDVEPIEFEYTTIAPYETREITNVGVEPIEMMDLRLEPYQTREITNVDVSPIMDFDVMLESYHVPDIRGLVPEDVEIFYTGLVNYMGEVDRDALAGLSDLEVAELATRKYSLISDLRAAFSDAGVYVDIDPYSGVIPISSTLLYATNEYQVTPEGKKALSGVFRIYCSVLSQEAYRDFVSQVVISGHTDNAGSYEYNQGLSMRRAEAVRDFCLTPECGIADLDWLAPRLVAEGHSYDQLIYNADGSVNMAASRRVEIGFNVKFGG